MKSLLNLILLLVLTLAAGANARPALAQQAGPTPEKRPDVQVLNAQIGGSVLPDPTDGPIAGNRINARVRNNTTDRAITGLLWKIAIADARTHKTAEVIYAYTSESAYQPVKRLLMPPRVSTDIIFDIDRKVRVAGPREISITLQDYVYKNYDAAKDRPDRPDLFGAGDWPYKSKTDPIDEEAPEKK